jgi:cobalt-zinc-cadmium resistance protein CzcA
VTVPLEIAMTGLPGLAEMRSLNKSGLSIITLVFTDATDVYFAPAGDGASDRSHAAHALGIVPVLGPVSTGLGEVYQYTLDRPDDGKRALTPEELTERRIVQDWVVRPLLRSIPGVAEINSQGGYAKQYQVLVDPGRLRHYKLTVRRWCRRWQQQRQLRRRRAAAVRRAVPDPRRGLIRSLDDIGNIVLKEVAARRSIVRDVAEVTSARCARARSSRTASPRRGGIVMMMRGGNAKEVVAASRSAWRRSTTGHAARMGCRSCPTTTAPSWSTALWTVIKVLLEGIVLVVVVLFLFLGDVRSSLIVVATLVLTPLPPSW